MDRFSTTISHTISSVFGTGAIGRIVTNLAMLGLRALNYARILLVRLCGGASAQLQVALVRAARPGVAQAARTPEPTGSGTMWQHVSQRPVKPGPRAKSA